MGKLYSNGSKIAKIARVLATFAFWQSLKHQNDSDLLVEDLQHWFSPICGRVMWQLWALAAKLTLSAV
jgi:hypothetical protein